MSSTLTIGGKTVQDITIGGKQVQSIYDNTNQILLWEQAQPDYFYFEDRSGAANSISITKTGGQAEWLSLEYSTDKETWNTWDFSQTLTLPANGKVYLRGDNVKLSDSVSGSKTTHSFSSSENVHAGGNAVSLLDKSCPSTKAMTSWFAFANIFEGMTTLVSTDTTLFDAVTTPYTYTFNKTFEGCTNLSNACSFTGITEATQESFERTYFGCTSLVTAANVLPNISSINGNLVFNAMFSGCTSLTTPPTFGSGVALSGQSTFMAMFNGCSALTSSPNFSFVTSVGTQTFRETFAGCSSLATAPTLNITSVASVSNNVFRSMFYQCTSLTSAANISITASTATENCFYQMFTGCTRLDTAPSVSIAAFSGNTQCTKMFYGCNVLTNTGISITASSVNTQTLKEMFRGCTALTTAPDLTSITTLGNNSLNGMFYGCSSLQSIAVGFTAWGDEVDSTASNYQATHNWTYGVNTVGTFTCPSSLPETMNSSDNTTTAHYIPSNWSVVNLQ